MKQHWLRGASLLLIGLLFFLESKAQEADIAAVRDLQAQQAMQRLTLSYLAGYLLLCGLGLLVAPGLALRLLLSNGAYGDIMPRVVGMFMLALGGLIFQFVRARDYRYYLYSIVARSFIVLVLTALYFKARDPLFLVLDAIVLIGLLPSIYVAAQSARARRRV